MAKTVNSSGTGTLSAAGPGTIASVTITDADVATGDKIVLTPTTRVEDSRGAFGIYTGASHSAGSFEVYADREQLPSDLTFNYISVT